MGNSLYALIHIAILRNKNESVEFIDQQALHGIAQNITLLYPVIVYGHIKGKKASQAERYYEHQRQP